MALHPAIMAEEVIQQLKAQFFLFLYNIINITKVYDLIIILNN